MNIYLSTETFMPQQADDFIVKRYFAISNIAAGKQKIFPFGSQ